MGVEIPAVVALAGSAAAFAALGGLHCAGMCGGLMTALRRPSAMGLETATRPVNLVRARPGGSGQRQAIDGLSLGYHAGRIASYTIAGALAGGLGARIAVTALLPLQLALLIAGSVALLVVAASLLGSANLIKRLEPLGLGLWWVVRKIAARLAAPTTALGAVGTGLAWGWIPCGMVYGALPLALAAGSGGGGAIVMLAFGIGTLPAMLGLEAGIAWIGAAGFGGSAPGRHSSRLSVDWSPVWLRRLTGVVVLVFALAWLAHAAEIAGVKNPAIASLAALCAHPLR